MAEYAARMNVAHPVRNPDDDGVDTVCGYNIREVMFDGINAKGMTKAKRLAREESKRYLNYLWLTDDKRTMDIPTPTIIDIARIKGDGTPVRKDFPSPETAKVRIRTALGMREGESSKKHGPKPRNLNEAVKSAVTKARTAVVPAAPPIFNLEDPLTEAILTAAMQGET